MYRRTNHLVVIAVAAMLLAGCGGGDEEPETQAEASNAITVVGQDDLTWDAEELSAEAGEITVTLVCGDEVNHNFTIEGLDEEIVACEPGETATGTVELEPGEYEYVCTVPGHEITMRGTLVVN